MYLPSSIFLYINNLWTHYTSLNSFFIISVINKMFITIFVPLLQTYFYIYFFYILFFWFFFILLKDFVVALPAFLYLLFFQYILLLLHYNLVNYNNFLHILTFRYFVCNTFFIYFYDKKKNYSFYVLQWSNFPPHYIYGLIFTNYKGNRTIINTINI